MSIRYVVEKTNFGVQLVGQYSGDFRDVRSLIDKPWGQRYEWGYEGAGPLRLATTILTDFVCERFAYEFMKEVIAKASAPEEHDSVAVFHEEQIIEWLKSKLRQPKSPPTN